MLAGSAFIVTPLLVNAPFVYPPQKTSENYPIFIERDNQALLLLTLKTFLLVGISGRRNVSF